MSLLDFDPSAVKAYDLIEEGDEVELEVISAQLKTLSTKKGDREIISVCFGLVGREGEDIWFTIWGPGDKRSAEKEARQFQLRLQSFMNAIGQEPAEGWNPDDWIGSTCWAIIGIDTYQGKKKNEVTQLVEPVLE